MGKITLKEIILFMSYFIIYIGIIDYYKLRFSSPEEMMIWFNLPLIILYPFMLLL